MSLPIHERFHSFQGEGVYAGVDAFFIRTYGCPIHCPWCDSAGTWNSKFKPKNISRLSEQELLKEVENADPAIVVLTGGEPTIHDLSEFSRVIGKDFFLHLETSGAFSIKGEFDWVTVSPKRAALPLRDTLQQANEIKIIVDAPEDIQFWADKLYQIYEFYSDSCVVWLHPQWEKRKDPKVLKAITEAVKNPPSVGGRRVRVRAGYQMHKLYSADNLDNRVAPAVPLGGDLKKGY